MRLIVFILSTETSDSHWKGSNKSSCLKVSLFFFDNVHKILTLYFHWAFLFVRFLSRDTTPNPPTPQDSTRSQKRWWLEKPILWDDSPKYVSVFTFFFLIVVTSCLHRKYLKYFFSIFVYMDWIPIYYYTILYMLNKQRYSISGQLYQIS